MKRRRCGGRRTELGCGSPTSSATLTRISTRATATRESTLRKPATSPILLQFSSLWRHCGLEQAFLSGYGQRETQAALVISGSKRGTLILLPSEIGSSAIH